MAEKKFLTMVQSAQLINLLISDFAKSGKTDKEFAEYATQKLGFKVGTSQVNCRREGLEIPAFNKVKDPASLLISTERMEAVERQLAADQKEFRGLAELFLQMRERVGLIEKALRLKGHFEGFMS